VSLLFAVTDAIIFQDKINH